MLMCRNVADFTISVNASTVLQQENVFRNGNGTALIQDCNTGHEVKLWPYEQVDRQPVTSG
jgi:hypothetical protein